MVTLYVAALMGLASMLSAASASQVVLTAPYQYDKSSHLTPLSELDHVLTLPELTALSCDGLFKAFDFALATSVQPPPEAGSQVAGLESGVVAVSEIMKKVPDRSEAVLLFKSWFADPCCESPGLAKYTGNADWLYGKFVIAVGNLAASKGATRPFQ